MVGEPLLFAFATSRPFGEGLAARIGLSLAPLEERMFEGGEHKTRPLVEVAGRDVFVVQSLNGNTTQSANDKLVRLLFLIGALRDGGAARVTAVVPYLAYGRKDRRTKPRDPVNSRYIAALFESVGTDAIVTVEVHNVSAFENAFRACRPEHVPIASVLADLLAGRTADGEPVVVSPDAGGDRRAELFRHALEERLGRGVDKAMMEKHRSMGKLSGTLFAGDVAGRTAIIVDDLISSGGTILRTAQACRERGAARVIAAAAHGLFSAEAQQLFGAEGPDEIIVTDTVPISASVIEQASGKLTIAPVAALVGDVIARLHQNEPVSDLFAYD